MAWAGRALTAGLLLAALGAISACADRPGATAPITLVFKHAHILGQGNPIPRLIAEFEARHPGVHVQAEALPWNSDEQRQFFVINLEGDSPGFDVMMLDVIWVPEFARAGWLLDLTPRLAPDELAAFFPSTVEAATYGGRVWGMPWNMNVGLLYYRRDLLDKYGLRPPETWTDLVAQAERIRAAERNPRLDGVLWQGKQYEGLMVNVLEGLWADGTELLGEGGAIFPDPARAEAVLAFMRGLITRGVSPPWTTAADEELTRRAFGRGEAVFLRNWPYALDLLEQRRLAGAGPRRHCALAAPSGRGARGGLDGRLAPGHSPGHAASRPRPRAGPRARRASRRSGSWCRAPRSIRRAWRSTTRRTSCARSRRCPPSPRSRSPGGRGR